MTMQLEMPTYRQWEKFWNLHITPEFRRADALINDEDDCHALGSLDRMREFFASLAGPTGDAVMNGAINKLYITLANHLASCHEFDMREDYEYTDADMEEMQPVIRQLVESMRSPILVILNRIAEMTEISLN